MYRAAFLVWAIAGVAAAAAVSETFSASRDHPAIEYATRPVADPIAAFSRQVHDGDVELTFERGRGYLDAVLDALDVPIESQVLVFSKTGLQAPAVSPSNPRAIYFNDEVAVAWIRGGAVLEMAAHDPQQGVVFYTLNQWTVTEPEFRRPTSCLQCHVAPATLGVPGLAVGSVVPDAEGFPLSAVTIDHRTPVEARWGGWYVTGRTGLGRHLGNTVATDPDAPMLIARDENLNLASVEGRFDTRGYLTPYSDVAALMVLEHQTQMTNLLTRVGWETRVALHEGRATRRLFTRPAGAAGDAVVRDAVRALVDYMLFVDEPLTDRMKGTSGFTATFAARGPSDRKGRSLRALDLNRRLMRYPCSYMIYSAAFDALPTDARDAIYHRMWQILSGKEDGEKYARLSAADRQAIVEILRDTKPGLPDYFRPIPR